MTLDPDQLLLTGQRLGDVRAAERAMAMRERDGRALVAEWKV